MKVGFTGTQRGMTSSQIHTLRSLLNKLAPDEFHHGCCVGADTQANYEAQGRVGVVVFHPPLDTSKMSDLREFPGTWLRPKPYLDRNRDIVEKTKVLIACPREDQEPARSRAGGTWYTIRYARRYAKTLGLQVIIIWPGGRAEKF
jgi:hypothetical protein